MSTDVGKGELIAIYSGKGGLGTTSIAINLAHAIAGTRPQSRVALADLVVAGGDVRVFLNLKPSYDLSHLVAKGKEVGVVEGRDFADVLFAVWIGAKPVDPALRQALLAGGR